MVHSGRQECGLTSHCLFEKEGGKMKQAGSWFSWDKICGWAVDVGGFR